MEINGLIDEINFQHYLPFITTRMCTTLKFNSDVTSFLFYGSRINFDSTIGIIFNPE